MKKIIFVFFLIFFIGCAEHNSTPKPKPLPAWYLNPPKSNNNIVYVSGSGIDKKQAVLNALSNFISRYNIKISSKFESRIQSFGGGLYNKQSMQDIKATVKNFEISNYSIEKTERYSFDKFFVLIKIDLNKLYSSLKDKLDNRFNNYKNEYKSILKENLLKQYIALPKLYNKLKKEENYIFFLKMINDSFDEKKYVNFINEVKNRILYVKNHLYVEIECNNKIIKEEVKKFLADKGLKIGKSNIKLKINVIKKNSSSFMKLSIYQIYINTEFKNTIIGNNIFKIVLPQNANINGYFFNKIKNMSLKEFLNLE